jgi:hypothetical protein
MISRLTLSLILLLFMLAHQLGQFQKPLGAEQSLADPMPQKARCLQIDRHEELKIYESDRSILSFLRKS